MASAAAVRQRVKDYLYGSDYLKRSFTDFLNQDGTVSSTDTVITVSNISSWNAGDIVEFNTGEQAYIKSVSVDNNRFTVSRAWNGTTAATVSDLTAIEKNPKYTRIYVIDLETGETTCVSPEGLHVWEFSWSPDNTKFAVISSDLPYEGSWFTSCRLVTFSENIENKPVILHQSKRQVAIPKWSPDGNQIAFLSSKGIFD